MENGMTLERLQVIIEAYTKPYQEELEKVKRKTNLITSHVERQTGKIRNSFGKVGKTIAAVLSIGAIMAFGKSCIALGSDLAEVQNVVDVTFGSMNKQVDTFAKNAITQFGLSELTAKKYMGTYGAMAKAFGFDSSSVYGMATAITGLTGDVASFYNLSADEAYTKLKSIFTGETESLKDLGVVMTQTALDQYALNNGFGKTTAKMTEQEKVMLRYQFVMSRLSDTSGDFARTSKSWANQTRILSLQFESLKATIGQGLINAFTPVIKIVNTLLARLQTLAGYFKAFTVALFGDASGGGTAVDSMADASGTVADNINNAAGAAKKMKEYALGIDELNVLNPDDGDSGNGSSGTGASGIDFGNLGGDWTAAFEPDANELVDRICSAFKDGDYCLAGEYIGQGITGALQSMDWPKIYQSAGRFGTGLAQFLNGLISPELFGSVAETIAGCLNTALYFLDSFSVTFDWGNLGTSVAEGINTFFQTFDFKLSAETLNHLVDGIKESIVTFLKELSWKDILKGAGEFFGNLELDTVTVIIGAFLIKKGIALPLAKAVINALAGGISIPNVLFAVNSFSLSTISLPALQVIGNQIISEIDKFIEENFGKSVGNAMGESLLLFITAGFGLVVGGPLGAAIGLAIGVALDTFVVKGEWIAKFWKKINETLFNYDTASGLWEYAKECFEKALNAENFAEFGINIIEGIANGIGAGLALLLEPIGDLFDWIVQGICDIFGIHSPAREMGPYGEYILLGIVEGFRNTFSEWTDAMNEWFDGHIAPWFTKKKWSELYSTIKNELKSTWDGTVGTWSKDISGWWNDRVSPWFTRAKWLELYESIRTKMKETWDKTSETWKIDLGQWWNEHVSPWFTLERWLTLYGSVQNSLKQVWDQTAGTWKLDMQSWWNGHVAPWFTLQKWTDMMGKVPEAFKSIFKEAVNGGIAIFNRFINWINDHMRFEWDDIEIAGQTIVEGGSIQLFKVPHIPAFAGGGFPEDGLFMANSGELVGRFSNGRTAVVNNSQIVEAVSEGVASAVMSVLMSFQGSTKEEPITINLVVDGRTLAKVVADTQRRGGIRIRTT